VQLICCERNLGCSHTQLTAGNACVWVSAQITFAIYVLGHLCCNRPIAIFSTRKSCEMPVGFDAKVVHRFDEPSRSTLPMKSFSIRAFSRRAASACCAETICCPWEVTAVSCRWYSARSERIRTMGLGCPPVSVSRPPSMVPDSASMSKPSCFADIVTFGPLTAPVTETVFHPVAILRFPVDRKGGCPEFAQVVATRLRW